PSQVKPPPGAGGLTWSGFWYSSEYGPVNSLYISEGTARVPGLFSSGPPSCTARSFAGAYACAGSWQVAHDIFPDADSEGSKNNGLPSCAAGASGAAAAAASSRPSAPNVLLERPDAGLGQVRRDDDAPARGRLAGLHDVAVVHRPHRIEVRVGAGRVLRQL